MTNTAFSSWQDVLPALQLDTIRAFKAE